MEDLLKALKENVCIIEYEKLETGAGDTGTIRAMACTLDPNRIPSHNNINQQASNNDIVVWCTDRDAWRSVRASTIKDWRVCEQHTN